MSGAFLCNMTNEEVLKKNGGRRYDVCLMNPPYQQGLGVKFLNKTMDISKTIISIQPSAWVEDTVGKYNEKSQFSKNKKIIDRLSDLEIIPMDEAEKLFGAAFTSNEGIFVCTETGGFDIEKINTDSVVDKVYENMPKAISEVLDYDEPKNCIIFSRIIGGNNGRSKLCSNVYGDDYKKVIYKNGKRLDNGLSFYDNRLKTAWGNVKPKKEQLNIKFNSVDECINFFNYTKTYLFNYIVNKTTTGMELNRRALPFMNDYSHEWTDKMLYDYFNITEEEQKRIETHIDEILKEVKRIEAEDALKKKRKLKK